MNILQTKTYLNKPIQNYLQNYKYQLQLLYCFAKEQETVSAQQKQSIPMSNNDLAKSIQDQGEFSFNQKFKLVAKNGGGGGGGGGGGEYAFLKILADDFEHLSDAKIWSKSLSRTVFKITVFFCIISQHFRDKCVFVLHMHSRDGHQKWRGKCFFLPSGK